jgi:8-oxo-dGTP pyrophosphatase MutT (NUDIX family)
MSSAKGSDRDNQMWKSAQDIATAQGRGADWGHVNDIYQSMKTAHVVLQAVKIAGIRDFLNNMGRAALDSARFSVDIPRHYKHYIEDAPELLRLRSEEDTILGKLKNLKPEDDDLMKAFQDLGMADSVSALSGEQTQRIFEAMNELPNMSAADRASKINDILDDIAPAKSTLKGKAKARAAAERILNMPAEEQARMQGAYVNSSKRQMEGRLADLEKSIKDVKPRTDAYIRESQNNVNMFRRAQNLGTIGLGAIALTSPTGTAQDGPVDRVKNFFTRPFTNRQDAHKMENESVLDKVRRQATEYSNSEAQAAGMTLTGAGTLGTAGLAAALTPPAPPALQVADALKTAAASRRPRVEVFIVRRGAVYLMSSPFGWIPPGGGTDGDSGAVAASREAAEECGLKIKDVRKLRVTPAIDTWDDAYRASQKEGRKNYVGCVTTFYAAAVDDPTDVDPAYATEGDGMRLHGAWIPLGLAIGILQGQAYAGGRNYAVRDRAAIEALYEICNQKMASQLDSRRSESSAPAEASQLDREPAEDTRGPESASNGHEADNTLRSVDALPMGMNPSQINTSRDTR